jgi:nuclear GTP-binding protein
MPGKTRVVQEVVLDKGVKIVDCPGVVLEDVARETDGEAGRRKQAEIMLRNCIKAELVEDPIAPGKLDTTRRTGLELTSFSRSDPLQSRPLDATEVVQHSTL